MVSFLVYLIRLQSVNLRSGDERAVVGAVEKLTGRVFHAQKQVVRIALSTVGGSSLV